MQVQQKSYGQIIIAGKSDFIFSHVYTQYEHMCPFLCFPGMFAADFRSGMKEPEGIQLDKDVILLLEDYWKLLASEEKKAVLDHELGHISNGDLKKIAEKIKSGGGGLAVDLQTEMNADAYSAEMNGKKAMHNGLIKALQVMIAGYKAQGMPVSLSLVLSKEPILKKRLEVLSEADSKAE